METDFKILLIEDNPGDAFLVKFYLNESTVSNYDITHAESLKDGLGLLRKREFDVILLDLNLPDSDGLSTLQEVLNGSSDSLVIVLTGLTDEAIGLQAVKMGAQDFLVKGQFDGKVLNSAVRYAFQKFKLNRELKEATLELNAVNEKFVKTQQLGNIGFWELNVNSRILSLTAELSALLGFESDLSELPLDSFLEKCTSEDRQNLTKKFSELIANDEKFTAKFAFQAAGADYFLLKAESFSDDGQNKIEKIVGIIQKVL